MMFQTIIHRFCSSILTN